MNIEEILEDLFMLDPALRAEEAELKKIIEKLIEKRPEAGADEEFKAKLKAELLSRIEKKKKRSFFFVHRTAITGAAALAATLIIVLTFAIRTGFAGVAAETAGVTSTEQAYAVKADDLKEADAANEVNNASKDEIPAPKAVAAEKSAPPVPQAAPKRRSADQAQQEMPAGAPAPAAEFFADSEMSAEEPLSEEYRKIEENGFRFAAEQPVSTFSIDVDTASYANVRRFINSGRLPDPDAVRIEELVNYFTYDYPQPDAGVPFSITTEFSDCPWNSTSKLLLIGLQGYEVQREQLPPANLVFLLDSSGSMQDENKLPLLKDSLSLLIDTLRPEDRVSIVAYAGSAGLVLPPTPGNLKARILGAVDRLEAGGSTAGGEGIDLAYRVAAENLFENGNNRVILATDGDFNVGQSSEEELKNMIERRRDQGIYLTVLGLGMGNYKDARMEALADNGNGNYAYIDTLNEANKVLVTELSSTLLTIAGDVKIQVEFNPEQVESYRLIGYENRMLAAEDFEDDLKDAGDIGAGHSVTALYEVKKKTESGPGTLADIRIRYKDPGQSQSRLLSSEISSASEPLSAASDNLRFASAVAEWGMILRKSDYAAAGNLNDVLKRASGAVGRDSFGYRAEFIELVRKSSRLLR